MHQTRRRKLIGAAMIAVGLVQAATGISGDEWVFAGLGLVYAALGVAYTLIEGYEVGG